MRAIFLLLFIPLGGLAQSLEHPVPLLNGEPLLLFKYSGSAAAASAEIIPVDGPGFQAALRLTTRSLPANPWDNRIRVLGGAPVRKNDVIVASFQVRCAAPEDTGCVTRLNVERRDSPYTKSANTLVLSGTSWQPFKLLFPMAEDYAAGGYYLDFWMGEQLQVADLADISFLNYGPGVTAADLGIDTGYDGSAPGSPWRAAALQRIDEIRKGNLAVLVLDAGGTPVPGATVHVRMKKHAFGFGSAVAADLLLGTSPDSEKYRQFILDNFNLVVFENDLKWSGWESNRQRALNGIRWMQDHGITKIRGHNLVWPGWQYLPASVKGLEGDPEALRRRILDHIQDEVSATSGTLMDWDVINEAYTNTDLQKILGDAEMAAWFRQARLFDPTVTLFINDYSILSSNGVDFAHQNGYARIIENLDALDAGVQGIGMQGHFGSPTPPETMLRILDRFARYGKQIEITEFDFNTPDEALQAQFTRDLLITAFSHPAVTNFLMWGFWEGRHWLPVGAMVRRDWTTKPNFDVWRQLVYGDWWTDETALTSTEGAMGLRGFLGDYVVEVTAGGQSKVVPFTLAAGDNLVTVQLDPAP